MNKQIFFFNLTILLLDFFVYEYPRHAQLAFVASKKVAIERRRRKQQPTKN